MKINIIIPYRPLSKGLFTTPKGPLYQLSDGKWRDDATGQIQHGGEPRQINEKDELIRAIKFLNKNSSFKHNIIVVIDNDVYPNDTYLKEFDNVRILKCKYIHQEMHDQSPRINAAFRANAAMIEGTNSIPDEDWLCYGYLSDLICAKDWDKYIIEEIQRFGENYVYVPMFVEIRRGLHNTNLIGKQSTHQLIWEEWRKLCCHALTMPVPSCDHVIEEDMDNYIRIANDAKKLSIIERPGDRIYGYFCAIIVKAKFAKKAAIFMGPGADIYFDNRLYSICNLMKVVVTKSFVFHPFCPFKE